MLSSDSRAIAKWYFYIGQPLTKYQIFNCFSKFCLFISNQTYGQASLGHLASHQEVSGLRTGMKSDFCFLTNFSKLFNFSAFLFLCLFVNQCESGVHYYQSYQLAPPVPASLSGVPWIVTTVKKGIKKCKFLIFKPNFIIGQSCTYYISVT